MPRMDEVDFKQSKFKRTSFRSWDTDLVSSLKMDREEEGKPQSVPSPPVEKTLSFCKDKKALGSSLTQGTSVINEKNLVKTVCKNPISHDVQVNDKKIPFLDENFRITKLINRLNGNEKKLFLLVIEMCNAIESTKTGNISSEDVENYLSFTRNSRESAIKRLCEKGLIKRNKGKRGLGGTINLSVSDKTLELANKLVLDGDLGWG